MQATVQTLRQQGANARQIQEIIVALTRNGRANNLDGNRILKLTLQAQEPRGAKELMRVDLFADEEMVGGEGEIHGRF
jgi:hypothetical protein